MTHMLKNFLDLFGSPLVKFIEDIKWIKKKKWDRFNRSIKQPLDVAVEINKTQPYWLFFTPNGNYDPMSRCWSKAECLADKPGPPPHWNCLFVDIDVNNNKHPTGMTREEIWKETVDTIDNYRIYPSFVVSTPGWRHLYWLIHPDDRILIQKTLAWDMVKILKHVTGLFIWWDESALAINKLMRLPFTNHWKTTDPLPVELMKYDIVSGELSPFQEDDFNHLNYIRYDWLVAYLEYAKEYKKVIQTNKTQMQFYSTEAYHSANAIPFPKLLWVLKRFPKLYRGKQYVFWITWTTLTVTIDWETEVTWWYKWRQDQNYVNCFSDSNHPIDERPRWDVMSFLHYYFSKDASKVKSFLKNEFMIEVDDAPLENEEDLCVVTKHDYSVIFTSRRVRLKSTAMWKTGQYEILVDLFKLPLKILGKWKTRMTYNLAETEDLNDVFLCESWINKFFLKRHVNKRDFNTKNSNLFFYGEDNDLGMFYEAMVFDPTIQSIDILSQSGIYDDCVYVGGNVIYWETNKFLYPAFEFDMSRRDKEQIWVKDFIDALLTITVDYIAVPAVLQTIVLAGMNIRWTKTIYPGMLLTGWTWSGKTVLSFILKSMIWYTNTSRTYSLGSLSPQPLKQYATDFSILFLEEITSNIQERCEEILRNVLNHNKWGRGTNTGTNVFYDFRSPVFALWERTFKDESINNRFLTLVMSDTQHKGNDEQIQLLQKLSCINDIYSKYAECKDDLDRKYEEFADRLKQDGVHARVADVWAYSFVINDLFQIGYTYDELYNFMKTNLKNVGYDLDSAIKIWKEHHLKSIIINWIMSRNVMWTYEMKDDHDVYTIMFMEDYYQKNRGNLNFMVGQFNKEWKERMWMIWNDLVVKVKTTEADPTDFVLNDIFNFILRAWKHVFTTINS